MLDIGERAIELMFSVYCHTDENKDYLSIYLRFVKRNIKTSNKKVKEMAYNTYVRPQLEYSSTIWSPWQKTLSQKIESV